MTSTSTKTARKELTPFEAIYICVLFLYVMKRRMGAYTEASQLRIHASLPVMLHGLKRLIEETRTKQEGWGFSDYKEWLVQQDPHADELRKELEND